LNFVSIYADTWSGLSRLLYSK